ncbi:MAG: TSUP family transporter [Burkholderiaceae bacterium]
MDALSPIQLTLIGLIFVWSGFVRSGLGFGGSVLSLPFFLLVVDDPLLFLPPIAIHLLIFSSWITWRGYRQTKATGEGSSNIDWVYLWQALKVMAIPKLIGVIGLLTISPQIISSVIFAIISVYAVGYILNRRFESKNPWVERGLLALGGYVSGTSLTGAPLIISVFANHVAKHQLRDTLFVLWFILVLIKMASFLVVGVDLQLVHQLWMFPCGLVGHLLGETLHARVVAAETPTFFRLLGVALLITALVGLGRAFSN